jgi:DNA-binding transcriptional LysR family regulator
MDVERLRLLRELAERGTVSAAAQAMSLTPSAVSQQLKILQREAGVPLLEPDGRRLRLTDAGRILVTRTDEILAALDRAQADMDSYRTTPRGTVRVGIFGSGAALLLAGLITRAAARGVEVLGREFDQSAATVPALLADFDVVVVHHDERDPIDWSPRLDATFLLREPLEVLLSQRHRLATRKRVPLRELAREPWIGVGLGLVFDDVLRSLATISGVNPRIVQRVNDLRVVEELVLAGIGIALMPRYSPTVRGLVRKPLGGVHAARRIEAVTRTGAATRPAIEVVIDVLKSVAQDMVEQDTRPQ